MKTLKKQIEEDFNRQILRNPHRTIEEDIIRIKSAILRLAQAIDNINHYGL